METLSPSWRPKGTFKIVAVKDKHWLLSPESLLSCWLGTSKGSSRPLKFVLWAKFEFPLTKAESLSLPSSPAKNVGLVSSFKFWFNHLTGVYKRDASGLFSLHWEASLERRYEWIFVDVSSIVLTKMSHSGLYPYHSCTELRLKPDGSEYKEMGWYEHGIKLASRERPTRMNVFKSTCYKEAGQICIFKLGIQNNGCLPKRSYP